MPATLTQSGGIRLRNALPDCRIEGPRDLRVASCSSDPRRCRPGDLFVALDGDDADGHDFATLAIARGATAVLAERPLPVRVPVILVDDTRVAYAQLCQALVDHPTRQLCTIGVSGTHGKTVVSRLMAAVLQAADRQVGTVDSLEFNDSYVSAAGPRSSSPPEMAHQLAQMVAAGCTHAVLEVDSRDLARRRADGLELDVAMLTNVRRAHLDFHGTVDNYRRSQMRLTERLKPGGFTVVNADDTGTRQSMPEMECPTLTASQHLDAEVTGAIVERDISEQTFLLSAGDDMIPVRTRMIGEQHVDNCLLVAAAALGMGIELPTIVRGLEAVQSVPRRLERIECGQRFGVFVDVADSPDRLSICLKTLKRLTPGRVICVADANIDGRADEHPLIGRVLERGAALGIITAGGASIEDSLPIIHDVIDGYDRPAKAQRSFPTASRPSLGRCLKQSRTTAC